MGASIAKKLDIMLEIVQIEKIKMIITKEILITKEEMEITTEEEMIDMIITVTIREAEVEVEADLMVVEDTNDQEVVPILLANAIMVALQDVMKENIHAPTLVPVQMVFFELLRPLPSL